MGTNKTILTLIVILIALLTLWINYVYLGPSQIIAIISALIWIAMGIYLWLFEKAAFVLLVPIYIGQLGAIISNAYLEGGTFILEQGDFSYATGSTLRLTILSFIFFAVSILVFKFSTRTLFSVHNPANNLPPYSGRYRIIFSITAFVLLLNAINLLIFGSPLLQGIQRFDYWQMHPFPILHKLTSYLFIVCFFLGSMYGSANSSSRRKFALLSLISYIFINILLGEKFTGIYLDLIYFFIGFILTRLLICGTIPRIFRIIFLSSTIFILLICLTIWHYTRIHGIDSTMVFDFLITRIFALQGHVWWGIDRMMINGHSAHGIFELLRSYKDTEAGGFYMLMYQIAPTSLVNSYAERGVTFSMGSPAIAVYALGYVGAVIYQLLGGILYGLSSSYLLFKLYSGQIFRTFIAIKIFLMLSHVFNMGTVILLISPTFNLYILIAIGDILLRKFSKVIGTNRDHCILSSPIPSDS
jgi:hypothetical protein